MAQQNGTRFLAQIGISMLIWLATFAFVNWQLAAYEHGPAVRAVLAAIGLIGFLPWLWAARKSIVAQDEFTQRVHLVSIAFAFAATAVVSLACDLLHKAGFLDQPPFSVAWIVMGAAWAISLFVTSRYYR